MLVLPIDTRAFHVPFTGVETDLAGLSLALVEKHARMSAFRLALTPSVLSMSSSATTPPGSQKRTAKLRPVGTVSQLDTTDYELSPSTSMPLPPMMANAVIGVDRGSNVAIPQPLPQLDAETLAVFHQRLKLCCFIASVPFAFFFMMAVTNSIELFGRGTVGWTGTILSGLILCGLTGTGLGLQRKKSLTVNTLRVLEIAIFGFMGIFFAYFQFVLLTSFPQQGFEGGRHAESFVLAAALITHFNWFALIVFHGVLVPNTLARGVGVVVALIVTALVIDAIAATTSPPTGREAGELFAISATMLLAGAGLSVFGTAKTEALRKEVQSAKQAVRELGQYRLRKRLGVGGMGEVYLAEHTLLKRPCALKRIHPRFLNNPEQIRRFEKEVQTTAQLRHPNTVEIYDYGRADDGTFYYVMEYLPGISLEDFVTKFGPMPADRVLHILHQVCGALREAHRSGLVHRDIKPSNIIVLKDGSPHDQAKLVDFGLVLDTGNLMESNDTKITREGLIVGTPEYMSPEQAQGLPLDERSDLFSLGCVAYFLMTGKEAFHRETSMKTLLAVVSETPIPIRKHVPFIPEEVANILVKCFEKDPANRFGSAALLDAEIQACACMGQWTESRSSEWWSRNPHADPGTGTDLNSLPV